MLIRIEGADLPGDSCGPGPDFPEGHHNIHVAIQGRKGQQDLFGLTRADASSVVWELDCEVVTPPPDADLRGKQIQGSPGKRFIYITWGVVGTSGSVGNSGAVDWSGFRMFRRAKLLLDAVPPDVMRSACDKGALNGRLRLADDTGWPICAAVRPPRIEWSS